MWSNRKTSNLLVCSYFENDVLKENFSFLFLAWNKINLRIITLHFLSSMRTCLGGAMDSNIFDEDLEKLDLKVDTM